MQQAFGHASSARAHRARYLNWSLSRRACKLLWGNCPSAHVVGSKYLRCVNYLSLGHFGIVYLSDFRYSNRLVFGASAISIRG